MSDGLFAAIEDLRRAEKEQAMFYRRLAASAEDASDEDTAQRLHGLHADEQHHLSRLTARLVELGRSPMELAGVSAVITGQAEWEPVARERESREVARYEEFLQTDLDPVTRALAESILEVEVLHRDQLGGKWMMA